MDARLLNDLTDYAVRVRYPGTEPTLGGAKEGLATAKATRQFARQFLNLK
jgi:hypothetical protein